MYNPYREQSFFRLMKILLHDNYCRTAIFKLLDDELIYNFCFCDRVENI